MATQAPPRALTDVLRANEISYELIPHRHTESAAAEARAVGVDPRHVAKTIVLRTSQGFARAVLPASERLDLGKVRAALDDRDVRLASEELLGKEYAEFELGAVPPVGGAHADPVLVDRRIARDDAIVFEAGTHGHSVRMKAADLVALARARIVDVCKP